VSPDDLISDLADQLAEDGLDAAFADVKKALHG